uniref:Uncharacterized protein n=2 Tax=Lotharella oceanica TaxID=641309 RepID=A0A7S2XCC4_9EUKA|mmetsp:Transcript_26342/g.49201  ORF Transcript_26342/g.49201 Transcript_26342/m.49201 type:complete len:206 (+) Transcript_26342:16-633(+)
MGGTQSAVQGYLRPATWVPYCKNFHDSEMTWHFDIKAAKKKEVSTGGLVGKSGVQIRPGRVGPGRRVSRKTSKKGGKKGPKERFCESLKTHIEQAIGKELVEGSTVTRSGTTITVSTYTGTASWLNVIDLKVEKNPSLEQGGYLVEAKASSTGIAPMYVPLAPVVNVALFWAPFPDGGSNEENLMTLEKIIFSERDNWIATRIRT